MGKLKEKYLEKEDVKCWHEVESGALLELPDLSRFNRTSLESIAALPPGTAVSSETTITEDGVGGVSPLHT